MWHRKLTSGQRTAAGAAAAAARSSTGKDQRWPGRRPSRGASRRQFVWMGKRKIERERQEKS